MKYLKLALASTALLSLVIFTNCGGGGGGGNPANNQASRLTSGEPWTLTNVTDPQSTESSLWDVLTVTFTGDQNGGSFTTNSTSLARDNATIVWPASGTWTFDGGNTSIISRNDNVDMTISALTSSSMTLTFTVSGQDPASAAGVRGVDGSWVFQFSN